ncbi:MULTISPECIES: hypothetical protein [Peptoniphilus]|uniref:DsrE family protein n=1 Tax=Peptoniphilus TaxID=162289 RepID=UPI0001DA9CBC|nr:MULTISPECIES: hypothetical protein [Peptoniphilus]EFI42655.1 hypothetical protein HMPREF0629_01314 [Peptoniphilus sp. oral taxon 386 str. F0131]
MKVLFHVVELDKWEATLSNARDILQNDDDAVIEVIVMSKAASLFGGYSGYNFEGLFGNPRIRFTIGETALQENNLDKNMLPNGIFIEKSAITKMARLQNEGYAYIRL